MTFRRVRLLAVALCSAAAFAACDDDDPTEPVEEEPEVASVRLTVGSNTVTVTTTTTPTLNVASGANTLTAQWLKADGTTETLVTDAEFEIRITGNNLTFTPSGASGGSLNVTGLSAGQTVAAQVVLFHLEEQHEDFGPVNFLVRVP